ncbi:hypothetical protein [Streptomyces roseolus]|uniref:hypothetical protein n=1 Tax=Streptomyces roseolus TaxID=67358 RepID=UPI0037B30029
MNWAELLNALLVAGIVMPPLLALFRLISLTVCAAVQTTAFTAMTVWSFLRGDAEDTIWFGCLTVLFVLLLGRDHRRSKARRHDQDQARVADRAPGPDRTASTDENPSGDQGQDRVITTVKKL